MTYNGLSGTLKPTISLVALYNLSE